MKKCRFTPDHSGVGCMDELFPTGCMVLPNEVEE